MLILSAPFSTAVADGIPSYIGAPPAIGWEHLSGVRALTKCVLRCTASINVLISLTAVLILRSRVEHHLAS